MLSNLVTGAVTGAFLVLLVPPFITSVTGSAARVGVVFAVTSLAAMLGPVFGHIADRYQLHRLVYSLSLAGMALAFVVFAVGGAHDTYSPIAGILLGASLSAKGAVGSGFLVGSGLPEAVQARQLTVFNLLIFGGQIAGGVLVAVLHLLGAGFPAQFWTAAAMVAAGAVFTALTTGRPARRLLAAGKPDAAQQHRAAVAVRLPLDAEAHDPVPAPATGRGALREILLSPFGSLLGLIGLGGLCLAVLSSQIANILPAVFGLGPAATGALVAGAGALGIPVVIVTGTWLARSGPAPAFTASVLVRAVGFPSLALAGLLAGGPAAAITAGLLYLAVTAASSLQRSPVPRIAALLSPVGASEANGLVSAAGAAGAFVGCLAAGAVATLWSYEAVLWLTAVAAVFATGFLPSVVRGVRASRP